ncbi:MAG: hypothetical protein HC923_11650 [Myxococcales bacterium]|nr:hypothetical protein [Myxococcales bacterium]
MGTVYGIIGWTGLVIILWDSFVTVFSTHGAGPITRLWTSRVWRAALAIHERKRIGGLLSYLGPLMLVGTVAFWYFTMAASWAFVFAAPTFIVESSTTGLPAKWPELLHFVGTTLSGVGYGDWIPRMFPWTLLSSISAFSATVVVTASLSYVLSVLSSAVGRKAVAQSIFSLGDSPRELIASLWCGSNLDALRDHLMRAAADIDRLAHEHLAFPLLHYFHNVDPEQSPSRAILMLSDAIFLVEQAVDAEERFPSGVRPRRQREHRELCRAELQGAGPARAGGMQRRALEPVRPRVADPCSRGRGAFSRRPRGVSATKSPPDRPVSRRRLVRVTDAPAEPSRLAFPRSSASPHALRTSRTFCDASRRHSKQRDRRRSGRG